MLHMVICEVDLRSTMPQIRWASPAEKELIPFMNRGVTRISGPHGIPHILQGRYLSKYNGCKAWYLLATSLEVPRTGHDVRHRIKAPSYLVLTAL
jgi:hypothetical protein